MVTKIVCGAFVFNGERVLLIKQHVKNYWMPPGGHAEENESFAEALNRELLEETGLRAKWVYGPVRTHSPSWHQAPLPFSAWVAPSKHGGEGSIFHFAGVVENAAALRTQESEISAAHWFSPAELETDPGVAQQIRDRIAEARVFIAQYGVR